MFKSKEVIKKELNSGNYIIKKGRTLDERTIQYKSINMTYTFRGRSICNLIKDNRMNKFMVVLNTGTEIIVTEQFYNEIEKLMI